MNVAFGGTLHQHVHELPGMLDHRKHPVPDIDGQYAPSHTAALTDGGFLHRLVGRKTIEVNSLHSQGCRPARPPARGGGASAGWSHRGDERQGVCVVRTRDTVASRMECPRGSGLARNLLGVPGRRAASMHSGVPARWNGTGPQRLTQERTAQWRGTMDDRVSAVRVMNFIERWCTEHSITEVEALMPDMSGIARGKIMPVAAVLPNPRCEPPRSAGAADRHRGLPRRLERGRSVGSRHGAARRRIHHPARAVGGGTHGTGHPDCFHTNGSAVTTTPRHVLRRVLELYRERGWRPVVAPELEFYLVKCNADADYPLEPPAGRSGQVERGRQSYPTSCRSASRSRCGRCAAPRPSSKLSGNVSRGPGTR